MDRRQRFPVVEMRGTPYEMGHQYGRQQGALIRDLAARFDALMLRPESAAAGRELANAAVPCVKDAAPDLIEEVEGIAAGCELTFEQVFRLNCSVELFAWQGCLDEQVVNTVPGPADGCSSFAIRAAEGPLVAWNMDWWRLWQQSIVLLHGVPDHGPRFYAFAFAGCVGRPGMSEQVAVAANYLGYRAGLSPATTNQWAGPGVPYGFLARILLQQSSTAAAADVLATGRRMACLNYTVGDRTGDLRCFETTPTTSAELRPEDDFLTHANSYLHPAYDGLTEERWAAHDARTHHARQQLRDCPRPLDRHRLAAVMQSHFDGSTTGICVHNKLQDKDGMTLLAFIADVRAGILWAAYGSPCEHEFVAYEL